MYPLERSRGSSNGTRLVDYVKSGRNEHESIAAVRELRRYLGYPKAVEEDASPRLV